jgi:hypothetical protein
MTHELLYYGSCALIGGALGVAASYALDRALARAHVKKTTGLTISGRDALERLTLQERLQVNRQQFRWLMLCYLAIAITLVAYAVCCWYAQ